MTNGQDEVILGSGKFYMTEFNGTMPDDSIFEAESNCLGRSKGGASLEYKPKPYEVKDDDGVTVKTIIVDEDAKIKGGILTWDLSNVSKLVPGTFSDDKTKCERILKIGGQKSFKQYAIRFVHTKDGGKKLRVTIVGSNQDGLTLKFDGAKETTIDPTFTAIKQQDKLLVEIRDEYDGMFLTGAAVNSGKVILTFNKDIDTVATKENYNITVAGATGTINNVAKGTNTKTIEITLATAPTAGQIVLLTYAKPADQAKQIDSIDGYCLDNITNKTVTNS